MTDFIYILFLKVLNMSIAASIVILFVLAARTFLRRLPKIFSYLLWCVVIFRLICPFSFTAPFSLLDFTNPKSVENGMVVYISEDAIHMGAPNDAGVPENGADVFGEQRNSQFGTKEPGRAGKPVETAVWAAAYVWILGILGITGYSVISLIRLKRKLVGAVRCDGAVWLSDGVSASFVMGIFHPRIYLWSGLSNEEKEFVIAHEETHIRRRDYLVKLLFYLLLTVHWFNPLVWLSYFLCMSDMEMSCDESVLKKMNSDVRADYSETLLSLATGREIFAGTPLFFGEGDTKLRIKNILRYKKPTMFVSLSGMLVIAVLCIGCMSNPAGETGSQNNMPISADKETKGEVSDTEDSSMERVENSAGVSEVRYPQLQLPTQPLESFTVCLTLPEGWMLGQREPDGEDIAGLEVKEIIGTFSTTYIFDEGGICVGKIGRNYYELYEGAEDNPQAIYNQVALGNHYQFDVRNTYEIVRSDDIIETGTANVLYSEPANDGGTTRTNYGILSRSKESLVYVVLELESGLVSEEDVTSIAESISFVITENGGD